MSAQTLNIQQNVTKNATTSLEVSGVCVKKASLWMITLIVRVSFFILNNLSLAHIHSIGQKEAFWVTLCARTVYKDWWRHPAVGCLQDSYSLCIVLLGSCTNTPRFIRQWSPVNSIKDSPSCCPEGPDHLLFLTLTQCYLLHNTLWNMKIWHICLGQTIISKF